MQATAIEWTDYTTNPIRARHLDRQQRVAGHYCEKISPGCAHCYASDLQKRFDMPKYPGQRPDLPDEKTYTTTPAGTIITGPLEIFLERRKLLEVIGRKKPTKIFWCDMTDLFGRWVPTAWQDACLAAMALSPQHTHQILTKRADAMAAYFADPYLWQRVSAGAMALTPSREGSRKIISMPGNIWAGVSVEDQRRADERIPHLLRVPAAVRFLSCEPLLGPIVLDNGWSVRGKPWTEGNGPISKGIDWVIVGGESGHGARPMHPAWARVIRDRCIEAGVPFHFKQWGTWLPYGNPAHRGVNPETIEWLAPDGRRSHANENPYPGGCLMIPLGKRASGRSLDGRTWDNLPTVAAELVP